MWNLSWFIILKFILNMIRIHLQKHNYSTLKVCITQSMFLVDLINLVTIMHANSFPHFIKNKKEREIVLNVYIWSFIF